MTDQTLYSYRLSGRRPMTIFAFVVSVAMMGFAAHYAAPWYFLVPVGLSAVMALLAIIANPQTGSTLSSKTLQLLNRGKTETIHIKDIVRMRVTHWHDGRDSVSLTLKSGGFIYVSALCADNGLVIALRELGVNEADVG
jgi:hypothetical protein